VLGASGFIGSWVVRMLRDQGARLHAVVRDPARAAALRGTSADAVTIADLARPWAVTEILAEVRPSIVFNLAGYGVDPTEHDPEAMARLNSRLVAELCRALAAQPTHGWAGLRLVHVGSALEYGSVRGSPMEDMPPNPSTSYGRTKLAGTQHVIQSGASSGLRSAVARLFTVYGPGEHSGRLLPLLLGAARAGKRLSLTAGTQCRDFTYVEDVAEGLLRIGISTLPPGLVVNLATGQLTSVRAFAETAASVFGLDPSLLDFGVLPARGDEMFHDRVDVTRLLSILSWRPRIPVAAGIRRTWEYQRVQ